MADSPPTTRSRSARTTHHTPDGQEQAPLSFRISGAVYWVELQPRFLRILGLGRVHHLQPGLVFPTTARRARALCTPVSNTMVALTLVRAPFLHVAAADESRRKRLVKAEVDAGGE